VKLKVLWNEDGGCQVGVVGEHGGTALCVSSKLRLARVKPFVSPHGQPWNAITVHLRDRGLDH
jgi:hypothetical protein